MKKLKIYYYIIYNIFLFKFYGIKFGGKLRIIGGIVFQRSKNCKVVIGDNFTLISGLMLNPLGRNVKSMICVDNEAELVIGNNVGMSCVSLWAKKSIKIGNNVKIGACSIIMDSDMHSIDYKLRRNYKTDFINTRSKEVIIRDDAFIGTNSIITKGVIIGQRSIIAAGSVVVKSVPDDEVWGGNPARFIKKIN